MLRLYSYSIPFKSTFKTNLGSFSAREGVLLRFTEPGAPVDLVSEAAPLPGFFDETLEEVQRILKKNALTLARFLQQVNSPIELTDFLHQHRYPPSVEFALSCLALDLIADRNREPGQLIKNISGNINTRIPVNFVTGLLPDREMEKEIAKQYRLGYRTLKFKCGKDPGNLPAIIRKFSARFPDLIFRIDANRAWTFNEALRHLNAFHVPSVEYCEEPLSSGKTRDFLKLKEQSPVPLALDESIRDIQHLQQVLNSNLADVIIIKPATFGNILNLIETFTSPNTHVGKRVFTSCLESPVGLRAIVRLTAILGSRITAHGLDTGRFLKQNFSELTVSNGALNTGNLNSWGAKFDYRNAKYLGKIDTG